MVNSFAKISTRELDSSPGTLKMDVDLCNDVGPKTIILRAENNFETELRAKPDTTHAWEQV